jgi:hypothetical protein
MTTYHDKPAPMPPEGGYRHTFVVEVPVTVTTGHKSTRGDAFQAGDEWVAKTLKPALDSLSGGPVEVHTGQLKKQS